jgi:hypothetical protein
VIVEEDYKLVIMLAIAVRGVVIPLILKTGDMLVNLIKVAIGILILITLLVQLLWPLR